MICSCSGRSGIMRPMVSQLDKKMMKMKVITKKTIVRKELSRVT